MAKFAMVSEAMLADTRLTGRQFKILVALRMFADSKTGNAHPKKSQISAATGVLERKVAADTSALVKLGWLEKIGDGGRSTSAIYTVFNEPKNRTETMTETVIPNHDQNGHGKEKETMTVSGINHDRFGSETMTVSGINHDQNGHAQVTDQLHTNEQTNNRPVAATPKNTGKKSGKNLAPANSDAPRKRTSLSDEMREACRRTWGAYSTAYSIRYGVDPVKNAKAASQVVAFVKRIGMEEAPAVASWYLASNSRFYVERGHAVGNLLADAEKLRTEWATGSGMTSATARQIDATQSNFNAAEQAKRMLAAREAA